MRKLFIPIVLGGVALVLAACGGGTPESVSYDINMTEYTYSPENLNLKVGQEVTLNLINSGQLQHEIMFGHEVMEMDNRPAGYRFDMFEASGVEPVVHQEGEPVPEHDGEMNEGFIVALPIDGTGTVTEDMVGEWEMGCFEQDGVHYDVGMKGIVTVTK